MGVVGVDSATKCATQPGPWDHVQRRELLLDTAKILTVRDLSNAKVPSTQNSCFIHSRNQRFVFTLLTSSFKLRPQTTDRRWEKAIRSQFFIPWRFFGLVHVA
jgi:hypothetical protein